MAQQPLPEWLPPKVAAAIAATDERLAALGKQRATVQAELDALSQRLSTPADS